MFISVLAYKSERLREYTSVYESVRMCECVSMRVLEYVSVRVFI